MSYPIIDCPRHEGGYDCNSFCDVCEGEQQYEWTPFRMCRDCGTPVDHDIWFEELGMCVDCSNQYWGHYGKYDPVWGIMGRPDNPLEACECGQSDPLPVAHQDGCPIWEAAKNEQMEREMK